MKGNMHHSNRSLAIIFSSLVAIIVGLIVVIVFINRPTDDTVVMEEDIITPADASGFAGEIEEKLEEDTDYLFEDAVRDYEDAIASLDGDEKVDLATLYALFRYEHDGNLGIALDILNSVKDLVTEETELSYYFAYVNIYDDLGDSANAAKYQNYLAERYPDSVDPYEVVKQEESKNEE